MPASSTPEPAASGRDRLAADLAEALVRWYRATARDLPWRRTRDPYRILVSEVMLQQTRVETVEPRYVRFLERFPDLPALAAADEQEVLAEWSGLGYYRRARNLHRLAVAVVQEYGGELPTAPELLRALPGVGEYTAAAVASIAVDLPHLAIDGNVERVVCRLLAICDDPRRAGTRRRLREAAADALTAHPAGIVNQALMDLGARVCIPSAPRCAECPIERWCRARAGGIEAEIPEPRRRPVVAVREAAAVLEREGRYLLFRGQRPGTLRDMWEFPTLDSRVRTTLVREGTDLESALVAYLASVDVAVAGLESVGSIRHGITNRRIDCRVFRATETENQTAAETASVVPPRLASGAQQTGEPGIDADSGPVERGWFAPPEYERLPLAAATSRILELLRTPDRRLDF